jgi:very-short-patch-repair endonuclease
MYYLPYNINLKQFSRQLRNNSTLGEILLWKRLRAGSIMNYDFNRQKPLDRYIVDFYCKPLKLVIEVDGGYHDAPQQKIKDKERQQILESMGLNFIRFTEQRVRKDMEWVIMQIENYIREYEIKYPAVEDRPPGEDIIMERKKGL